MLAGDDKIGRYEDTNITGLRIEWDGSKSLHRTKSFYGLA